MDFEILKVGKFTNSKGQDVNFSQEDLSNIASNYNPAVSEAPIVIGHPQTNDPAFGWIDSLKVEGEKLIASASKIVPEFLTALKDGLFKKRSVSLNPDNSLRHVGFLGATLPAVKGLADLQFSELPEENLIEFADCPLPTADCPLPTADEFHLSDALSQINSLKDSIEKFKSEFSEFKDLKIIAEQENNSFSFSSNFKDEVDQAFQDGKLTVPIKEKLLSLLTMDFAATNPPKADSLQNFFSEFLLELPVIVPFDDFATPPVKPAEVNKSFDFSEFILDSESEQVHKKILEIVIEKNITYPEAAQIVFNS